MNNLTGSAWLLTEKLGVIEKRYVPLYHGAWKLLHTMYILKYLAGVIVDRTWLVSVMVDGKYKYLKMSALQCNIVTSQFTECFIDEFIIF